MDFNSGLNEETSGGQKDRESTWPYLLNRTTSEFVILICIVKNTSIDFKMKGKTGPGFSAPKAQYKDKEKPTQIRYSNITAAKGLFTLVTFIL